MVLAFFDYFYETKQYSVNTQPYLDRIEKEKNQKTGILDLSEMNLTEIPFEISDMVWLKELTLSNNSIITIEKLDKLQLLKKLRISKNKISKIQGLDQLINLEVLNLFSNHISNIEGLNNLVHLSELHIFSNEIQKIEGLEKLEKLQALSLSNNRITKMEGLNALKCLTNLFLAINQISKIEGLEQLNLLHTLDLRQNRIAKIENLDHSRNLCELYLNKNYISSIENISQYTNLNIIDLEGNSVENIEFLKNHPKLETIGLSNTNVKDISPLSNLQNLTTVYLSQCKLESIEPLANKPSLKRLVLSNTGIKDLRPLLPNIEKGLPVKWVYGFEDESDGIYIKDNTQLDIPKQIIEQGTEAILKFYKLEQAPIINPALEKIFLYEAKLIIVGEGKVGKSSLRVKLMNKDAVLPKEDERTRGIDIVDYKFTIPSHNEYVAHIWDFGGQNIQFALHRFFMTENSLYILMTESRQERDKNFDYWFQNIELFGGKESPIIVTMNLTNGERGANIDIASYTSVFKNIKYAQIQEINLLDPLKDNSLEKLTSIVQQELEQLPHIKVPIFRCWLDGRESLLEESKTNNYISIERFHELCNKNGIEESYVELVGRYLHNLGVVLWYHDKEYLKNKMILNPLWAINAIYKIIDDKAIQDRKGIFDQKDKDRLWSEPSYKFAKDELTSLLREFKICFQRQNKEEYIVPALMDAAPPNEVKNWTSTDCKKVVFHFPFMPKGLVNQLTADMHKHIMDEIKHVWAYGILLHYADENTTQAYIVENTYKREIQIEVKGMYAAQFIGVIIQSLKTIIDTYKGLKNEMRIPCNCEKCIVHSDPQIYTEAELIERLKEDRTQVFCKRYDDKIDMQPILESIGIHHPIFDKQKKMHERIMAGSAANKSDRKIKVFLSYSHAQVEYFKIFKSDLQTYLRIQDRQVEIFQDFEIPIGEKWDDYLQDKVAECDVMILLVSQEFMNSSYIQAKEFGGALKHKNMLIAPVYFAPCEYKTEKELSSLQFFKPNGSDYEQAAKGLEFSYINLVKFRDTDAMPIPNSNRNNYMKHFTDKLKKEIALRNM